jgi:hypothetical protein
MGICWPRTSNGFATVGQSLSGPGLVTGRQDEGEFIAAHPGDEGIVGGMLQAPRDGAEQLVANDVAEQVVGLLEVIEVDRQKRKARAVLFGLGEGLSDLLGEGGAIGQIGERVMMGEMGDVAVPGEELGSRGAQLFARFAEAERRFPHLFLQDVETFSHLAKLVT